MTPLEPNVVTISVHYNHCRVYTAEIVPPSTVTCEGLPGGQSMNVSWTPPENPQFDIDHYIVRSYRDEELYTTMTTRNESLIVELPSGVVYADVRTVSICGTISPSMRCNDPVTADNGGLSNPLGSTCLFLSYKIPFGNCHYSYVQNLSCLFPQN